jgi:hypothetical protein
VLGDPASRSPPAATKALRHSSISRSAAGAGGLNCHETVSGSSMIRVPPFLARRRKQATCSAPRPRGPISKRACTRSKDPGSKSLSKRSSSSTETLARPSSLMNARAWSSQHFVDISAHNLARGTNPLAQHPKPAETTTGHVKDLLSCAVSDLIKEVPAGKLPHPGLKL